MSDLVERYVHQVGRYLPKSERADILTELRSQIYDALDDRYGASLTQADEAQLLAEFGDPHAMALSYGNPRYLVGPSLYPYMMTFLRHACLFVLASAFFLHIFGGITAPVARDMLGLVIEALFIALQAVFIVAGVVVLIFAVMQHVNIEAHLTSTFDPLTLPAVDDPRTVDRIEAVFGIIIGMVFIALMGYFLAVGGLTLQFNPNDVRDVIPVPTEWLVVLIGAVLCMVMVHGRVLWRNQWHSGAWLVESIAELVGAVGLYFVVYRPIMERIIATNPSLAESSWLNGIPALITIVSALIIVAGKSSRLIGLWQYTQAIKIERKEA